MIDLVQGDVLEVLRQVPDNTFHAVLTDPPYGLSFMGKHWDYDVPSVEVWREVTRVLRPGGAVLSFGGTRTYHRLVCNAEDGGLEVRDQLCWLYAKGFPKSLNVSKALDKAGGASPAVQGAKLRSTREALGLSRASVATAIGCTERSVRDWEDGRARSAAKSVEVVVPSEGYRVKLGSLLGYASDAREVHGESADRRQDGSVTGLGHSGILRKGGNTDLAKTWDGYGTALKPAHEPILLARKPLDGTVADNVTRWGCGALDIDGCRIGEAGGTAKANCPKGESNGIYGDGINGACDIQDIGKGRWPANLLLDEGAAEVLDETVGPRKSGIAVQRNGGGQKIWGAKNTNGARPDVGYSDSGGPSRFFFSSKVSTRERDEGCDSLPLRTAGEVTDREDDTQGLDSPRVGAGRQGGARNHHPTLKPIALARYLAQLVRPPGSDALILIPFAGAGSEVIGATLAGWAGGLAIERDADYVQIARARIAYHLT